MPIFIFFFSLLFFEQSFGQNVGHASAGATLKSQNSFKSPSVAAQRKTEVYIAEPSIIFDLPVEYNGRVKSWIDFFQTRGKDWFGTWLERSNRVIPKMQAILIQKGLPKDLVYMAMIESGFSHSATSHASAVGPWQFIKDTGTRYGLRVNWWIDERRDMDKSTVAAANYLADLYQMFGSWYLVAAAYNTGENRIKRLIKTHQTRDFWVLAKKKALHPETMDYVPKLIAAMLISKAPGLYGFRNIKYIPDQKFEHFIVPGGTRLSDLSKHLGVTLTHLKNLNPELLTDGIPVAVHSHRIRIPVGTTLLVSNFVRQRVALNN
jgi:membrane-bound lytic murein transglycosylase D